MVKIEERMLLSEFYRTQVIRLRKQIQNVIEDSFTVDAVLKRLINEDFYFNVEGTKDTDKSYFYVYLNDENGKTIYPPKFKIQPKDIISFEINIPQFKGECVFLSDNVFNKEEIVCLMSVFSKFKDLLYIIAHREIKRRIPRVLNEAISRGTLETKDQLKILNEMLKEVIEKNDESTEFLFRFNLIFQNVINTIERVGVMAQSYLGMIDDNTSQKITKKPVHLKRAFDESLQFLPTDVDKDKFSIFIDENLVIKIDEDKLRYAISNILSYGNRKSDHITINIAENHHQGEDVVILIVLSGIKIDEREILSLDENKLRNCIELSSAIEYVKEIFKGRFWMETSESKGTILSISLPIE